MYMFYIYNYMYSILDLSFTSNAIDVEIIDKSNTMR